MASLNTTHEPPPSKLPENKTPTPTTTAPAPVAAPIPASGSELWFYYQGKVPENLVLVVDKARQRLLMLPRSTTPL